MTGALLYHSVVLGAVSHTPPCTDPLSPCVFPGVDLIAAFYGCLYCGCVPVTVRPPHPQNLATTLPTVKMIVEVPVRGGPPGRPDGRALVPVDQRSHVSSLPGPASHSRLQPLCPAGQQVCLRPHYTGHHAAAQVQRCSGCRGRQDLADHSRYRYLSSAPLVVCWPCQDTPPFLSLL